MNQRYLQGSKRWEKLKKFRSRLCVLLLLCNAVVSGYARSDDWAGWSSVKIDYAWNQRFHLIGHAGFRLRENFSVADRARLNIGGRYRCVPHLNVEAAYETHYSHSGGGEWEFRHRYYMGVIVPLDVAGCRISWRERFQQTFSGGDAETLLRSQLRLAYGQNRWACAPFLAVEAFQPIGNASFWSLAQIRYRPGGRIKCSPHCTFDVYYCRQYTPKRTRDILGVELGNTSVNFYR